MSRKAVPIEQVLSRYTVAESGCWEWTGYRNLQGYGQALRRDETTCKYRPHQAHRLAYEFHCGPIPDGHVVMHKCDNPACINPAHLMTGTQAENLRDMSVKGRHRPRNWHLNKNPTIDELRQRADAALADALTRFPSKAA